MLQCSKYIPLFLIVTCSHVFSQMGDNEGEQQPDLPPSILNMESPVLSTNQALDAFVLQDGFKIELVASEPMIEDPVAAIFAPDGSLWVIEMQSFMPDVDGNNEHEPISRVVTLRDQDGDGIMDTSTVFMDGLVLPRAIAFSHDGILLVAPPNLLYCRDITGDGVCDDVQTLTGGFGGLDSIEHAGNGMLFGLDNTFHNSQHGYSFKFNGEELTAIPVPAHGQWGITHDDFGRNYYAPNSYPILVDEIPKHYATQGGKKVSLHGLYKGIVNDKRVYPVRPTPGINRGYQAGRLDENYKMKVFDAACGPLVYRDTVYGDGFENSVFVCETVGNLVSRYNIEENVHHNVKAVHAYDQEEFLASTDERFRPVNLTLGPDGAIYIIDMYRGIVQHRMFVTSFLRKQIKARGLEKPLGLGRIWRVVPTESKLHEVEDLSNVKNEMLVEKITHPNGTVRDIAQRLLVESPNGSQAPYLQEIATNSELARDRIKALWTLDGMGLLTIEMVLDASKDESSMVRTHALRLGEQWRNDQKIIRMFNSLSTDANALVRRQAALSTANKHGPEGIEFILKMAKENSGTAMRSSIFASLSGREKELLDRVSINKTLSEDTEANRLLLSQIVDVLLQERNTTTNSLLFEFITKQIVRSPWQSEVVLTQIKQYIDKSKRQFKLSRSPSRWKTFLSRVNGETKDNIFAVNENIWWPNRTDVNEVVRNTASQEVVNLRTRGKKVYNICKTCHQVDGLGLPPTYPPLAGSEYVSGDADAFIKIMLHGLSGPLEMDGVWYEDYMPPAPVKNDFDVAAVITYVRQAWGNDADFVKPSAVAATRKEYKGRRLPWTIEELNK